MPTNPTRTPDRPASPGRLAGAALCLVLAVAVTACDRGPRHGLPGSGPQVVLMGTTDIHSQLLPWDYEQEEILDHGLARISPLVDSIRAANPGRTILVDSGDLLQGNPMAATFTPLPEDEVHPMIVAMNLMEYDAAALGNHEFNFGLDHLDRTLAHAEFPFLSANTVDAATGEPVWPEYVIVERELEGRPLRIGITGVLPPGVAIWDRDHVEGILEFPDMVERLADVVPRMRADGADLVVVAAHASFEGSSYDTESTGVAPENRMSDAAREVPGIDVVFLGHSHREVADTLVNDVLFTQGGPRGRSLAVATFELAPAGDDGWRVTGRQAELVRPTRDHIDTRMQASLSGAHDRTRAEMARVLATAPEAWSAAEARIRDTPLMSWIHQVQKEVTGADLSSAAAFGLRAGLPQGDITVAHVARLYPYDNNLLRAVEITGAELRAYLEHSARYFLECPEARCERLVNREWPGFNFDMVSGVEYTLDLTRPLGERVVQLERNGEPVADDDTFTMAINNYRQGGGGGFPAVRDAPVVYTGDESVRDLLMEALEAAGEMPLPGDFEPS
ncbi:MAG: bifunctional metallophosphatase/5'-nucleotidase, partial [Gemmatimonadales bacterium]